LPILEGHGHEGKNAFVEILNNYSIVTSNYKLGLYTPYNEGELYDRKTDPDELFNVYNNKKYEGVVDSLTKLLIEFNPDIKIILKKRSEFQPLLSSVELKHGDYLRDNEVPFIPGKTLNLLIDIKFDKNPTGPIITYDISNTHGFSLYIENGKLFFGIRKFGKEFDYSIPRVITGGKCKMKIEINSEGILNISDNITRQVFYIQTSWPLPILQGRPECFSRILSAGVSGDGWIKPYGNLSRGINLQGTINSCLLSVGNR